MKSWTYETADAKVTISLRSEWSYLAGLKAILAVSESLVKSLKEEIKIRSVPDNAEAK